MTAPAACGERGVDPRWFEGDAIPDDHKKARAVCAGCPRVAACLAEGKTERLDGVYGGRLLVRGKELRTVRVDARALDDATLRGYHAAYVSAKSAGVEPSPLTAAAEAEYQSRAKRAARAAARAARPDESEASAA